jgi:hypothetical protein
MWFRRRLSNKRASERMIDLISPCLAIDPEKRPFFEEKECNTSEM